MGDTLSLQEALRVVFRAINSDSSAAASCASGNASEPKAPSFLKTRLASDQDRDGLGEFPKWNQAKLFISEAQQKLLKEFGDQYLPDLPEPAEDTSGMEGAGPRAKPWDGKDALPVPLQFWEKVLSSEERRRVAKYQRKYGEALRQAWRLESLAAFFRTLEGPGTQPLPLDIRGPVPPRLDFYKGGGPANKVQVTCTVEDGASAEQELRLLDWLSMRTTIEAMVHNERLLAHRQFIKYCRVMEKHLGIRPYEPKTDVAEYEKKREAAIDERLRKLNQKQTDKAAAKRGSSGGGRGNGWSRPRRGDHRNRGRGRGSFQNNTNSTAENGAKFTSTKFSTSSKDEAGASPAGRQHYTLPEGEMPVDRGHHVRALWNPPRQSLTWADLGRPRSLCWADFARAAAPASARPEHEFELARSARPPDTGPPPVGEDGPRPLAEASGIGAAGGGARSGAPLPLPEAAAPHPPGTRPADPTRADVRPGGNRRVGATRRSGAGVPPTNSTASSRCSWRRTRAAASSGSCGTPSR